MSRGGRGGGRGASTSGVRAIANVLGIARHDIGSYTQVKNEPPKAYPPLNHAVLPLETTNELHHEKAGKRDVKRYTDRYKAMEKEPLEPQWSRVPDELNWRQGRESVKSAKRRKVDNETFAKKLATLERKETEGPQNVGADQEEEDVEDDDAEGAAAKAAPNEEDEEAPPSDDDYMEEDNDYIQNYFDNGEGYGEGSDDNLEEDNVY
ncbi:DNA-directed RNA polymerase III [Aphelenchoides avenae]|nr:DNA-directed RNA polymerase III [Aphelenchus avenae]